MLALLLASALIVDGTECPVEDALRAQLPGVTVGAPSGSPDDLHLTLRIVNGGWLLELSRPDGARALRRFFMVENCEKAAPTVALIVDRYLDEIYWSGKPPPVEPLPPPAPPPGPPPPPPIAPLGPEPVLTEITFGPSAWRSSDVRPGALLTASVRWSRHLYAGMIVLLGSRSPQAVADVGQIDVAQFLGAAELTACAEPGALRFCGGPLAGARGSFGTLTGAAVQSDPKQLWQPELGAHGSVTYALTSHWALALHAIAGEGLGSATFTVGGSSATRTVPGFDVAAAITLSFFAR